MKTISKWASLKVQLRGQTPVSGTPCGGTVFACCRVLATSLKYVTLYSESPEAATNSDRARERGLKSHSCPFTREHAGQHASQYQPRNFMGICRTSVVLPHVSHLARTVRLRMQSGDGDEANGSPFLVGSAMVSSFLSASAWHG